MQLWNKVRWWEYVGFDADHCCLPLAPALMNPGPPPSTLQTPGFAHYSLAWSPFHTNRIALASSANYGLIGNGRLHIVELSSEPKCLHLSKQSVLIRHIIWISLKVILDRYDTQDALYDVAWSEIHENQLLTASGDGSIKLWDIMLNVSVRLGCFHFDLENNQDLPICAWNEHSREVFSVDWSNISKNIFASSSWDGRVKLVSICALWKCQAMIFDPPSGIQTIQGRWQHYKHIIHVFIKPFSPLTNPTSLLHAPPMDQSKYLIFAPRLTPLQPIHIPNR